MAEHLLRFPLVRDGSEVEPLHRTPVVILYLACLWKDCWWLSPRFRTAGLSTGKPPYSTLPPLPAPSYLRVSAPAVNFSGMPFLTPYLVTTGPLSEPSLRATIHPIELFPNSSRSPGYLPSQLQELDSVRGCQRVTPSPRRCSSKPASPCARGR